MSRASYSLFALVILLALIGGGLVLSKGPQVPDSQHTSVETGYPVDPAFQSFYDLHGGRDVLGFALSGKLVLTEAGISRQVQYFQKGRLEVDPMDDQVRLSALPRDQLLDKRTPPIQPGEAGPGADWLEPTGHSINLAFKEFYYRYGGPAFFGYPITEVVDEGDQIVQYFERMILQWNPERPRGKQVELVAIGENLLHQAGLVDPGLLKGRIDTDPNNSQVVILHASVEVLAPVVPQVGGRQEVYVWVSDQFGEPVQGARVSLGLDGQRISGEYPTAVLTNEHGVAIFAFELTNVSAGEIISVRAQTSFLEHTAGATGSFRVWW